MRSDKSAFTKPPKKRSMNKPEKKHGADCKTVSIKAHTRTVCKK
jgi:hypothetical protein